MDRILADEESPSEFIRSTHVLVVRLEKCRIGDWMPDPDAPVRRRFAEIELILEDVLKGTTEQLCGESVVICVRQRSSETTRLFGEPGNWSDVDLHPSRRLVAFCQADSTDLTVLLQPPRCRQLSSVDALQDLYTCRDAEARDLCLPGMMQRLVPLLPARSKTLARYVWARSKASVLRDDALFDSLLRVLEHPVTSEEVRAVLLAAIHHELSMRDVAPRRQSIRFAHCMFSMLGLLEGTFLQENVARVYLPSFLGLQRGEPLFRVDELFSRIPGLDRSASESGDNLRHRLERMLIDHPDFDPDGRLAEWLEFPLGTRNDAIE